MPVASLTTASSVDGVPATPASDASVTRGTVRDVCRRCKLDGYGPSLDCLCGAANIRVSGNVTEMVGVFNGKLHLLRG